jgi:transposase
MTDGARIIRPDRQQLHWDTVNLDSQLPPDHPARLIWAFVSTATLDPFYARIKARDAKAGRPATDPAVLLALWLFATTESIGSARLIDRLCQHHAAYRWLCGGVPINRDMLAAFRRDSGNELDTLMTQSLTALLAEGLVDVEEVAIDGTKVRARAGRGSYAGRDRLQRIETAVAKHVASLKAELDQDPASAEHRRQDRALRAAQAKARRLQRAQTQLAVLEQEKEQRRARHKAEEAKKAAPRVSTSDPEARLMRMPDGAVQPGWNVQVATAKGFIVAIEPTDRRKDSGLAVATMQQVQRRCGRMGQRLLADGTAVSQDEIVVLATQHEVQVFSPPPREREDVSAETLRKRRWKHKREPAAVKDWRARMDSEAGQAVYRRRKLTEHAHARLKNRGFGRMPVHGLAGVRAVCLLHALAHNLLWADRLRQAA